MKKSIIALSAILTIGQALAQSTTSTTTVSTGGLDNFLKNSGVDYYGAFYNDNQGKDSSPTTFYHEITGSYKYGSGKVYFRPRFESLDGAARNGDGSAKESELKALNPRMGIRPYTYTNGNFTASTELRFEAATTWGDERLDTDQYYGTLRAAVNNTYALTKAITLSGFVGLYENVVKENNTLPAEKVDSNLLLVDLAVNYAFNDKHSLLVNWETNSFLNEDVIIRGKDGDAFSNKNSDNFVYLRYINSQIKNIEIMPGIYFDTEETASVENAGLMLEVSAKLL